MSDNNYRQQSGEPTRRSVLKSMGAGSAGLAAVPSLGSLTDVQIFGSATAATGSADDASNRSLVIEATDEVEYVFTVTGLLSAVDAPSDIVEMGTGSATLENDSHEFSFTGEFTAFDIEGDATVIVDGERFNYETFPHNTLKIVADNSVDYDVSATGAVEIESGDAERPNARRATGTISGGNDSELVLHSSTSTTHTLSYAGELTYLDVDDDATVVNNGTEIDPDQPLPSIESGQAKIRSLGTKQDYSLHLGWDVARQSKHETINDIDQGIVRGTATFRPATFLFNGVFQFVEVPGVGTIKNPRTTKTIECIAANDEQTSFTIVTSNGSREELTLEPNEPKTAELSGQIRMIRMETEGTSDNKGIQLNINAGATDDAAERAKKLQLAAKLEREPEFEPLATHAKARGGRIRMDPEGITAMHFRKAGDPRDRSPRDSYITARYELANTDGYDVVSIEIVKNTTIGETEKAHLRHHSRTEENVPQSVEVGELAIENSEKEQELSTQSTDLEDHNRITTESTYTSELTDDIQVQTAVSDRTVLRTAELEYNLHEHVRPQSIPVDPCTSDWVPCDDARDAFEDGASEAGKSADWLKDEITGVAASAEGNIEVYDGVVYSGMTAGINASTAVFDWGYELDRYAGFTDRGAAAFNIGVNYVGGVGTYGLALADHGEINSCTKCLALGRTAVDMGVHTAGTSACTYVTGGVGALQCSMFMAIVSDYAGQYAEETAVEMACEETGLC